ATATLFAQEGAILILSDIDEKGLEETYEELKDEQKKRTTYYQVDVRNPAEVKQMIDRTIEKHGKIDVLIVNAGVVRVGPVETFPDEEYDLLIDVNLKGTHYTCKYAVPQFKKQKSGSIITLASVAAHIGQVAHANYCSTKAGVLGYTRALALDLAPYNVRVNSVSPGATDTPMLQSDVAKQAKDRGVPYEEVRKEFEEEGVLGRWAEPEEIATGILFLATEESSYMTGADLRLDGGWTTR
ncbi:MAG: SDR family oxidoreductase, partial [Candidatus Lokiarchaeota archaeon]|nr:SDR family oxidoreductase [Candidatus Lokiarchaeota archaeon]MBD3341861.1 SDR family oxidoreductase [Candidatus Lokiarchaeota archaeon]